MLAYKLLEDSLHVYTNRVPLSELIVRVTSFQKSDLVTRNDAQLLQTRFKMPVPYAWSISNKVTECSRWIAITSSTKIAPRRWLFKSSASCPNCRKIVNDGCANYLMSLSKEERNKLLLIIGDDFVREASRKKRTSRDRRAWRRRSPLVFFQEKFSQLKSSPMVVVSSFGNDDSCSRSRR